VLEDREQMISDAVDGFLAGFDRVFGRGRLAVVAKSVKVAG